MLRKMWQITALFRNPARHVGWVSEFGIRLHFDKDGFATCEESKEKYSLKNNIVKKISSS